jgi:DNA-binding transcriptional LysR family regulator
MNNLNGDVLISFVLKDMGVAFSPRFVAQDALGKGLLQEVQITESLPQAQIGFAFLIDQNISPHSQSFVSRLEKTSFTRSTLV